MKKIYLSICALVVSSTSFAQQSRIATENFVEPSKQISVVNSQTASSVAVPATIIWQDDCSNAADWTMANASIPPLDWSIETDPNAVPTGSNGPMTSTTASNGYLFINSDGSGGGDNDGTPIICTATTAGMIDCSAYPYIELTFQHNYRWWQDTRGVQVSNDGGASWIVVDTITDLNGYPNDQNSGTPEVSVYNISSICGGQDSVMVQFFYDDNDFWAWYWAVDDVMISEIPDNSMAISNGVQGGWWQTYATTTGDGFDYTFKPQSQIADNPYAFEAVLRNAGLAPQNTTLNVEVRDGSGSVVFSDVSNTVLLDLSFPQDTFVINSTFAPSANGVYEITMWGVGDSVSTDSTVLYTMVTDYEYGRDLNQANGSWRVGRTCGGMVLAVKYDIYADETLYSIQAFIDDQSIVGTAVFAQLWEDDAQGDPIFLTSTDDVIITAAHLGNWMTIPFDGGEPLIAGGAGFYAAVSGYANPIDTFNISVSGESQGGAKIQDNGCQLSTNGTFGDWYNISSTPMIRMSFDPASVSMENNVLKGDFNVYPNPNNGIFTIEFNNVKSDDYLLTVTNVLGQEVYTSSITSNGLNSETVDLTEFDKGIYILEISNDNATISEKIIIE